MWVINHCSNIPNAVVFFICGNYLIKTRWFLRQALESRANGINKKRWLYGLCYARGQN